MAIVETVAIFLCTFKLNGFIGAKDVFSQQNAAEAVYTRLRVRRLVEEVETIGWLANVLNLATEIMKFHFSHPKTNARMKAARSLISRLKGKW